jgi:hypothetical protein
MSAIDTFLNDEEVRQLTGCKLKSLQIENLRKNGLQFTLNRQGKPVVPRCAITGQRTKSVETKQVLDTTHFESIVKSWDEDQP